MGTHNSGVEKEGKKAYVGNVFALHYADIYIAHV